MIRLYNGCGPPLGYSTTSGRRCTFVLAEYSMKKSSTSPTFLVLKVQLEVLHDSRTALLTMGMYLIDPFSKKRRSPLDPVSRRALIVLWLSISLSLASSSGGWPSFRRFLDQFRPNFFKLDPNLVYLALFLALVGIKLLLVLPYKCITATAMVTLPVLAISRAFSSALVLLIGIWSVTLIGWGWVDLKSDKNGSSNLRCLSTTCSLSQHPASYSESELQLLGEW
jgi:hypothetical protein